MWRLTCVLLMFLQPHLATAQFDLAERIFQHVHDQLENSPLNMGRMRTPNIFNPFGTSNFLNPFGDDMGQRIFESVHRQLAPLNDLGWRIQQSVSKSLAPTRALGMKNSMKNGIGGTTVATYYGNRPRSFIIKDGFRSVCRGRIIGPHCYGSLEPFDIRSREDFCYAKSYAYINGRICLTSGNLNVESYNNDVTCRTANGSPTLFLTQMQYRQLCGNIMPWQVRYTYYANPNDPMAVSIPNSNPYVKCLNNQPGVCEFEGNAGGRGTVINSSSGFNFNSFQ